MLMLEEKNSCADHYLAYLKKETQRLSRYNVLNEVFQLSSEEENGLVNGLRIGYIKELQNVLQNAEQASPTLGFLGRN
jgi:hypothetical protein